MAYVVESTESTAADLLIDSFQCKMPLGVRYAKAKLAASFLAQGRTLIKVEQGHGL